jgi:hypothetical protein
MLQLLFNYLSLPLSPLHAGCLPTTTIIWFWLRYWFLLFFFKSYFLWFFFYNSFIFSSPWCFIRILVATFSISWRSTGSSFLFFFLCSSKSRSIHYLVCLRFLGTSKWRFLSSNLNFFLYFHTLLLCFLCRKFVSWKLFFIFLWVIVL